MTEYSRDLSKRSFGPATAKYRELGTATNLLTFNRFGALPTRNFQSGTFERRRSISPEQLRADARAHARELRRLHDRLRAHLLARRREAACALEYESLFALGSLCGVGDADAVLRASQRCDELGIDTISAGGTIAFAMECVERGLARRAVAHVRQRRCVLRAIELIGQREGVGAICSPRAAAARRRRSGTTASRSRRR